MTASIETFEPPHPMLLALEARVGLELVSLLPALPFLAAAPRGDGHPVVVLPGFMTGDGSTRPLRAYLRSLGYHVHGWRLGVNRGPSPQLIEGLGERFRSLRDRHGRKTSLIGWSLGGIYARELARHFPGDVRQVILLGSPFRNPSATNATWLFQRIRPLRDEREPAFRRRLAEPLEVPVTSFYSRTDGIVPWRSCLVDPGPYSQNVEVFSSHLGIGFHPVVFRLVANRLAQPEDDWRPLDPPAALSVLYRVG